MNEAQILGAAQVAAYMKDGKLLFSIPMDVDLREQHVQLALSELKDGQEIVIRKDGGMIHLHVRTQDSI